MQNQTIQVGIVGAAGFTGGELIRILLNHPVAKIKSAYSTSQAGQPFHSVHRDLLGYTNQHFTDAIAPDIDVLFLCLGHGLSKPFLAENPQPPLVKIIDLSRDFRDESDGFVYGLPELNKSRIAAANKVANPGCFASCIMLSLLPLALNGLLNTEVHISGITGSTGAGRNLQPTVHFSWRHANMSAYKAFTHQHLIEVGQILAGVQPGFNQFINFMPYRGNYTRGIICNTYLSSELSEAAACQLYANAYADEPFSHECPYPLELKPVVNTNNFMYKIEKHHDKLMIGGALDNLVKGASGQAVQNLNLMFGLPETTGLYTKPIAF